LLTVAIADLLSVFLGVELIRSGKLGQFVRTDAPYYSLFQTSVVNGGGMWGGGAWSTRVLSANEQFPPGPVPFQAEPGQVE
ncbi:MAG: hypothetical protein GY832_10040, partial [Chloroflexi bacterium]|nr:hypothetical protein [Chloroflexota bacterium]